MEIVTNVLTFAEWWLYIGAAVALYFLTFGIDRIDENARGAYVFRPLLIPGVPVSYTHLTLPTILLV